MKKLALVLGSLLVVSAAASAKEVVPAPVVVEEAPVQIVEKEVIVYREKAPEWKPNGNLDVQYKYYGEVENKEIKDDVSWADEATNYSRLQLEGNINLTPADKLNIRVRNFNSLDKHEYNKADNTRMRYYHTFGDVYGMDTTSRLEYERGSEEQSLEGRAIFDFSKYMFSNDYVKTTNFSLEPSYKYTWADSNDDDYTNTLGLALNTEHEFPFGFSFEADIEVFKDFYGYNKDVKSPREFKDGFVDGRKHRYGRDGNLNSYSSNTRVEVTALLRNHQELYAQDKLSIAFDVEGGYDTYNYTQKGYGIRNAGKPSVDYGKRYHRAIDTLKLEPSFTATYAATKFVDLYAGVGAEYANKQTQENEAKNWRWQPYAFAGFNVAF